MKIQSWEVSDTFWAIVARGLAEYDDMEGIAWRWQAIDGSMNKAPFARESSGMDKSQVLITFFPCQSRSFALSQQTQSERGAAR